MTLYQQYYQDMIDHNKESFAKFQDIHDLYVLEPEKWQQRYNEIGKDIITIIREYERKLCATSEKGQFGKYSQNLSDKFWGLVRQDFKKIDYIGIT